MLRFNEIGQQLRAYRLESGLRAEEIAARLGVSRAALYRYEKGEVIKLDTIQRLAELLKISPLSLLGIGVEYYNRPIGFFERLRQVEETAEQMMLLGGPLPYLISTDAYERVLGAVFDDLAVQAGPERLVAQAAAEQLLGVLAARRRTYQIRRPGIIAMLTMERVTQLLTQGLAPWLKLAEPTRDLCRQAARAELTHLAATMEAEPMGLQVGLIAGPPPPAAFAILRGRERASVVINPFHPDAAPAGLAGVAMVTSAEDAVAAHQRVAAAQWREAVRGPAAAAMLHAALEQG